VDGVNYFFVGPQRFSEMVENDELLEWAVVHGRNSYGTPRKAVEEQLNTGVPALLEIDLQGARQVKESMPDAQFIFLAPPSWEELVRRLIGRGTESAEEQERRLETARVELAAQAEFDHIVINDDVTRATDEIIRLMGLEPKNHFRCSTIQQFSYFECAAQADRNGWTHGSRQGHNLR
jgi:guanylate kinase